MKQMFVRRTHRGDVDQGFATAAFPRSMRRSLADAPPGVAPAQRWQQLQQRIDSYHVQQAIAQRCASGVAVYYVCVFLRPRFSLMAPIM